MPFVFGIDFSFLALCFAILAVANVCSIVCGLQTFRVWFRFQTSTTFADNDALWNDLKE